MKNALLLAHRKSHTLQGDCSEGKLQSTSALYENWVPGSWRNIPIHEVPGYFTK